MQPTNKTEFQEMAMAFAAVQAKYRDAGVSMADMAGAIETFGSNPDTLADALTEIARPPCYPHWRTLLDAVLITLTALCIVVLAATPGEWWYKVQCMFAGGVALAWLFSLEDRWNRRRQLW